MNTTMTMSSARDDPWKSDDGSLSPSASLTSPNPAHHCASGWSRLEDETIVTKETHESDDDECDNSASEDECSEDLDDEILNYANANGIAPFGVPAEVKVSFDNDAMSCHHDDDSDSEPSDADESEEEFDAEEEEESELEDCDEDDESVDRDDSADEYETEDDDSDAESEARSEDDDGADSMDDSSCGTASSRTDRRRHHNHYDIASSTSQHELFLPWDVSPSVQSLKYEEDDVDTSDDEDDRDVPRRTYPIGKGRGGRPRMWDGCPSSISVSSDSGSSVASSRGSSEASDCGSACARRAGVSFSESVTVYPVFETTAYSPSMVRRMYTKRDELRVNKLRNKREFAHDLHDWRNATEEEEMEPNDEGELVHPVHVEKRPASPPPCRTRNVVQTYSSALGGYTIGSMSSSGVVHRAKRMRMYYP